MDHEEYKKLYHDAYNKALDLLNISMQTESMLHNKLLTRGFPPDIIDAVIHELKQKKFINDDQFAELYVAGLVKTKHLGINKILNKLRSKGIDQSLAYKHATALIEDHGGEAVIMTKFVKKNAPAIKRLLDKKQTDKIKRKLYNNGFTVEGINHIMSSIDEIITTTLNEYPGL